MLASGSICSFRGWAGNSLVFTFEWRAARGVWKECSMINVGNFLHCGYKIPGASKFAHCTLKWKWMPDLSALCGQLDSGYLNLTILLVAIVIVTIMWFVWFFFHWTPFRSTKQAIVFYFIIFCHIHRGKTIMCGQILSWIKNKQNRSLAHLYVKHAHFLIIFNPFYLAQKSSGRDYIFQNKES